MAEMSNDDEEVQRLLDDMLPSEREKLRRACDSLGEKAFKSAQKKAEFRTGEDGGS